MSQVRITRREFLKLSAAAAALASASCSRPVEHIVPYANQPEAVLPGVPSFYASAASFVGAAEGLLIETNTGRPTKVEGNPAHPGSLGGTSVQGQASVLELWDPDRSKAPKRRGVPATLLALERDLQAARIRIQGLEGEGLHLLARSFTSPTLARQLEALQERLPRARIHRWDPLERTNGRAGAHLAFGRPLEPLARLDEAGAILSLDSRFLDDHPWRLNHARQFARARTPRHGRMTRLYAFESAPSLVGAMADHRYAAPVADIERFLLGKAPPYAAIWKDLAQNRGVILAGESLSPQVHALVHGLNQELRAPISYVPPIDAFEAGSIEELTDAMGKGEVALLVVLEGNPAYDAPADVDFAGALARVPLSLHLSLHEDETSALCTWHLPATHFMEHWSDARALDGTASVVQPVVAPLYESVSPHELLARLLGTPRAGYDIVRDTWAGHDWEGALRKGTLGTQFRPAELPARPIEVPGVEDPAGWSVRFVPDECVLDGRFANNAWLQELPKPHTKLTWDNAALLSPDSARELGVATGDMVEIRVGGRTLTAPAWVTPSNPARSITLALGYGRERAGSVGNGCGFDAYRLRTSKARWSAGGVEVQKAAGRFEFATTQNHARMEGRDLARSVLLEKLLAGGKAFANETPEHSLYLGWPYDGYRWAMSINLNTCIGCNACTIACQAENNIPTVGKEQVIAGREMHWIRVDRYYEQGRTLFQPVPCMHCENAPCEYVCPVEASVHDSEGLNVQVYNRCVGTRFCSQNCPYKVRRFNFLEYSSKEETLRAQKNPEVTVRMRGVMEKCTYCVQRITRGRIEAEKEGRRIRDGDVVTACQAACPTGAIVFGDLNDEASLVNQAKRSPLRYELLAELNTRPRTSYQARLVSPNPDLPRG